MILYCEQENTTWRLSRVHCASMSRSTYDIHASLCRAVTTGGQGGTIPRAPIHYGSAESLRDAELLRKAPKSPNNVTSTFFNTVNLLSKELRFDHGGAKLVFCPGRYLTSIRPCRCVILA